MVMTSCSSIPDLPSSTSPCYLFTSNSSTVTYYSSGTDHEVDSSLRISPESSTSRFLEKNDCIFASTRQSIPSSLVSGCSIIRPLEIQDQREQRFILEWVVPSFIDDNSLVRTGVCTSFLTLNQLLEDLPSHDRQWIVQKWIKKIGLIRTSLPSRLPMQVISSLMIDSEPESLLESLLHCSDDFSRWFKNSSTTVMRLMEHSTSSEESSKKKSLGESMSFLQLLVQPDILELIDQENQESFIDVEIFLYRRILKKFILIKIRSEVLELPSDREETLLGFIIGRILSTVLGCHHQSLWTWPTRSFRGIARRMSFKEFRDCSTKKSLIKIGPTEGMINSLKLAIAADLSIEQNYSSLPDPMSYASQLTLMSSSSLLRWYATTRGIAINTDEFLKFWTSAALSMRGENGDTDARNPIPFSWTHSWLQVGQLRLMRGKNHPRDWRHVVAAQNWIEEHHALVESLGKEESDELFQELNSNSEIRRVEGLHLSRMNVRFHSSIQTTELTHQLREGGFWMMIKARYTLIALVLEWLDWLKMAH